MVTKFITALLVVWLAWLGVQYFNKSGQLYSLAQQKIEEFDSMELDRLLSKVGKGYQYEELEAGGKKYQFRWSVSRLEPGTDEAKAGSIEIRGRLDFIDLLPFGLLGLRAGSPFKLIINIRNRDLS